MVLFTSNNRYTGRFTFKCTAKGLQNGWPIELRQICRSLATGGPDWPKCGKQNPLSAYFCEPPVFLQLSSFQVTSVHDQEKKLKNTHNVITFCNNTIVSENPDEFVSSPASLFDTLSIMQKDSLISEIDTVVAYNPVE